MTDCNRYDPFGAVCYNFYYALMLWLSDLRCLTKGRATGNVTYQVAGLLSYAAAYCPKREFGPVLSLC